LISGISPIISNGITTVNPSQNSGPTGTQSFGQFLQNALDTTNQLLGESDTLSSTYAAGGPVSVDQLMIAEQKASLALDTVVQVRNRVVSAYQSIMNMQV
jgi:flagellar hook-basal body complex protein FliE